MPHKNSLMVLALFAVGCGNDEPGDDTNDTDTNETVECEDGVCVLTGTITEDLTLTADVAWLLRGGVFIGDDANRTTLTIEPGTTIYGESSTDGMLVVTRHSQILADGTAEAPIVFTSSKAEGSRARGDWGGLIINGRAPVNSCGDDTVTECEAFGEGGTGWYGGSDTADNSGILRYVRVEFAGTLVSPDNELNGIAFQGVGSGTVIDHIQVHMNADDGVEFFGGTANAKHVLLTGIGDDNLDWTDGWQGKIQFLVAQQYDDNGDNGIEADNNAEANEATPMSEPTIANATFIGAGGDNSDLGLLLREGTGAHLSNLLVTNWGEACLNVDHDATWANGTAGALTLTHTTLHCTEAFLEDDKAQSVQTWFEGGAGNLIADPGLDQAIDPASPDYRPTGDVSNAAPPADAFFEQVDYRGGVDPAADWTQGWTTHTLN